MGEHGHYQKTTLFENATRVPLVMAGPGIAQGGVAKSMAEMVDFYPTLAELAGLEIPEFVAGLSLAPALADPSQATRTSALTEYAGGYSIRTDRYRYTEWGEDGIDGNELYDHHKDPGEMTNLAGQDDHANTIAELSQLLRRRIREARRPPQGIKQIRFDNRRRVPQRNS
jgi:arylsulfatase A-like enzyme